MRESLVVKRLSDTTQNALINIVTIFLGLGVGSKLSADKFLNLETLGIIVLGLFAFSLRNCCRCDHGKNYEYVLIQKNQSSYRICWCFRRSQWQQEFLIKIGLDEDPHNFLLMHAMGPNVAGVIGSAVAAGILLAVFM